MDVIKPKYIRTKTIATYLGRRSANAPLEFKLTYPDAEKTPRSTYLRVGDSEWSEGIKVKDLVEKERYVITLALVPDNECFRLMAIHELKSTSARLWTTPLMQSYEVFEITNSKTKIGKVVGTTVLGLNFSAGCYTDVPRGLARLPIIPVMMPKLNDLGDVQDGHYKTNEYGETVVFRYPSLLIRGFTQ